MKKIIFSTEMTENYGPCSCGQHRSTCPVKIPLGEPDLIKKTVELFPEFATGYDYRRCFGTVDDGEYIYNLSACPDCCKKAKNLGLAEEGEVDFTSNRIVEQLFAAAETLFEKGE